MSNQVNHPSYYTGKKECIDAMIEVYGEESVAYFCLLNSFKYVWRMGKKNTLPSKLYLIPVVWVFKLCARILDVSLTDSKEQDERKARWYYSKYLYLKNGKSISPNEISVEHIKLVIKKYTDIE